MWNNPKIKKEKAPAVPNILCACIDMYLTENKDMKAYSQQLFVRRVKKASKKCLAIHSAITLDSPFMSGRLTRIQALFPEARIKDSVVKQVV
jgi:hypothetical protein